MNKPAPLSQRQKEYFDRCFTSWFNVAEGGKRGGKNVLGDLCWGAVLDNHPDRLHLAAGVSTSTAKLNILDCDGYGLLNYFEGRCREGKYKGRDCLYIHTKAGEKIVLISGGGKDGDEKLIKGNTYGSAYVTEANECHPNFIKEVFDRTVSSGSRKVFHDLNPKAPQHWYYQEILAFHEEQQKANPAYGYNYGHFTIADNYSIGDAQLQATLGTYDKTTVWYQRDMLGKRKAVEGLIYRRFADNPEAYTAHETGAVSFSIIGVDFGGNGSAHAFNSTGFRPGLRGIITLDEFYSKEELDANQLANELVDFVRRQIALRYRPTEVRMDSAETVLIRTCRRALQKARLPVQVLNAKKGGVMDRVRFYNQLIGAGWYEVMAHCKGTIDAFSTALYNPKAQPDDERLDDGSTNIDSLDAQEYSTEPYQQQIIDILTMGGGAK